MQEDRNNQRRNYLIFGLSGCLLGLVFIMFMGTSALIGLYFYDRYGLPELVANDQSLPVEQPLSTPADNGFPQPALATLAPPLAEPSQLPTPTLAQPTLAPAIEIVTGTDSLPVTLDQRPPPNNAQAYLERLYLADQPAHDYYDSAVRLGKFDVGDSNFH